MNMLRFHLADLDATIAAGTCPEPWRLIDERNRMARALSGEATRAETVRAMIDADMGSALTSRNVADLAERWGIHGRTIAAYSDAYARADDGRGEMPDASGLESAPQLPTRPVVPWVHVEHETVGGQTFRIPGGVRVF